MTGILRRVRSADFLAGLALLFSSLLFFYDLFNGRYLLTERDLGPYFIPPRFFWVESIKRWDFPLWNPFQFSGHPFFANPQHAVLYPLNGLFFFLPFDIAFNGIIILHFFLGGLFTYLLLRDLKVNPAGALISGLTFMLSGYLLSVHSLLTILLSSVWTPLIILFFRRAINGQGFKNEIFTAIVITISFLSGGIEIVYGNFFVLLLMVIFSPSTGSISSHEDLVGEPLCGLPVFRRPRRAVPTILKRSRSLLIVSILFLFLSSIQLIPFLELWIHSIRSNGITFKEATIWSFAPKDILLFFLPDAYGYFLDMKKYWVNQCWFKTLYMGGLPFILSLIYFFTPHPSSLRYPIPLPTLRLRSGQASPLKGEENSDFPPLQVGTTRYRGEGRVGVGEYGKHRRLLLALMAFSLFLSLGWYNPLYRFIFQYVPFFNGIRYPAKFLYIFILVISIAAGMGFQRMIELPEKKKTSKNLLTVFSLFFGLLLLFSVLFQQEAFQTLKAWGLDFPDFNHLQVNLYHAKRFLFYLCLFFLLLRTGYEIRWKTWAKVLLLFFLATDLFGNMGFYWKENISDYFRKTKISEIICSNLSCFRVLATPKTIAMDTTILVPNPTGLSFLKERHLPSLNLLDGFHDPWGIDVIRLRRVDDLYRAFAGASSISANRLLDVYGISYVVSVTLIEKDPRLDLIYSHIDGLPGKKEDLLKENTIKLYRHKNPLPRAWLVSEFKVMAPEQVLSTMMTKDFDPGRTVLLEEMPPHPDPFVDEDQRRGAPLRAPAQRVAAEGHPYEILPEEGRGKGKVRLISESNNRLKLNVKTTENTLLVVSDTFFPGWKVFVDGKKEKVLHANYHFRAVTLPPGSHQVEFVYDPWSFKLGVLGSLIGIIGCFFFGLKQKAGFRLSPE